MAEQEYNPLGCESNYELLVNGVKIATIFGLEYAFICAKSLMEAWVEAEMGGVTITIRTVCEDG